MNVWFVAPRRRGRKPISRSRSLAAGASARPPARRRRRRRRRACRRAGRWPRPKARTEGEKQRREQRRAEAEPEVSTETVEKRAGECREARAEQAHPFGDRTDGNEERPELPQENVERIAARMGNAEQVDGGDELTAVAHIDGRTHAERVDEKGPDAEAAVTIRSRDEACGVMPPFPQAGRRGCVRSRRPSRRSERAIGDR